MADDYIPRSDPEFLAWTQTFVTYLNANLLLLGLTAADVTPITSDDGVVTLQVRAEVSQPDFSIGVVPPGGGVVCPGGGVVSPAPCCSRVDGELPGKTVVIASRSESLITTLSP